MHINRVSLPPKVYKYHPPSHTHTNRHAWVRVRTHFIKASLIIACLILCVCFTGHSHQIFHICSACACYCMVNAVYCDVIHPNGKWKKRMEGKVSLHYNCTVTTIVIHSINRQALGRRVDGWINKQIRHFVLLPE